MSTVAAAVAVFDDRCWQEVVRATMHQARRARAVVLPATEEVER
jgi:hypothetical protein